MGQHGNALGINPQLKHASVDSSAINVRSYLLLKRELILDRLYEFDFHDAANRLHV